MSVDDRHKIFESPAAHEKEKLQINNMISDITVQTTGEECLSEEPVSKHSKTIRDMSWKHETILEKLFLFIAAVR